MPLREILSPADIVFISRIWFIAYHRCYERPSSDSFIPEELAYDLDGLVGIWSDLQTRFPENKEFSQYSEAIIDFLEGLEDYDALSESYDNSSEPLLQNLGKPFIEKFLPLMSELDKDQDPSFLLGKSLSGIYMESTDAVSFESGRVPENIRAVISQLIKIVPDNSEIRASAMSWVEGEMPMWAEAWRKYQSKSTTSMKNFFRGRPNLSRLLCNGICKLLTAITLNDDQGPPEWSLPMRMKDAIGHLHSSHSTVMRRVRDNPGSRRGKGKDFQFNIKLPFFESLKTWRSKSSEK